MATYERVFESSHKRGRRSILPKPVDAQFCRHSFEFGNGQGRREQGGVSGPDLSGGSETGAALVWEWQLVARTCSLRCFLSRTLFEDERTHSEEGRTGEFVKGFGCRPFAGACHRVEMGPAFETLQGRKPRVGRAPSPLRARGILAPLGSFLDRLERRSKTMLKDAA